MQNGEAGSHICPADSLTGHPSAGEGGPLMARSHWGRESHNRYCRQRWLVKTGKASFWMPYRSVEEAAACLRLTA